MLDQPVHTPLTKNPKFNTHKVFATVGAVLITAVVVISSLWIYLNYNGANSAFADDSLEERIYRAFVKPVQSPSDISNWKLFTNKTVGYSFKYPETWLVSASKTSTGCNNEIVFLAPDKKSLGSCGQSTVSPVTISLTLNPSSELISGFKESSKDFKQTVATVGSKSATRVEGLQGTTVFITYLISMNDKILLISYSQGQSKKDYSDTFDKIVSTFKFQ